jgi:hypothetical protein
MLPAPLTTLAISLVNGTATSTFSTRAECFLTGFVLERSAGTDTTAANGGWQPVATVGAGLAGGQYALADPRPLAGLHYYRLGLRRPDGTTDYAAPVPLLTEAGADAQVFPNPITGSQVQLAYPAAATGNLVLRFYDELGRYHRGQRVAVQAGLNLLTLDVTGLRPGFYILRLTDDQGSRSIRVVKL